MKGLIIAPCSSPRVIGFVGMYAYVNISTDVGAVFN